MINLQHYFSPRFVAGVLVATVLLAVPVVAVAAPVEEPGLDERLFLRYDEGTSDIIKQVAQLGFAETEVLEGNLREVLPRIQFHTRLEGRKPGGFLNELSFSQLPDIVYLRIEYSGLKSGQQYLQKLRLYDPEGNVVRNRSDYEFTTSDSRTQYYLWYKEKRKIFTGLGNWRVEGVVVDRSDNRYLVFFRDLLIGE